MRHVRAIKRAATQAPRGYCSHCKSKRMVHGTTVHYGVTHPAMVNCPQCVGDPRAQLQLPMESAAAPLDHQERAAGEKRD